jgi:hypothetical protein
MTDLVRRLRNYWPDDGDFGPIKLCREAADRIERLERENVALGLKLDAARMGIDELKKRETRWITDFRKDANTLADIADRLWTELDRVEPENG